jgi:hypothetical protein
MTDSYTFNFHMSLNMHWHVSDTQTGTITVVVDSEAGEWQAPFNQSTTTIIIIAILSRHENYN